MRLDPFIRDCPAFMDGFAWVLNADGTDFYLDMPLLLWLIRLSAQARRDFIAWPIAALATLCGSLSGLHMNRIDM